MRIQAGWNFMLPDLRVTYTRIFEGVIGTMLAVLTVWVLTLAGPSPAVLASLILLFARRIGDSRFTFHPDHEHEQPPGGRPCLLRVSFGISKRPLQEERRHPGGYQLTLHARLLRDDVRAFGERLLLRLPRVRVRFHGQGPPRARFQPSSVHRVERRQLWEHLPHRGERVYPMLTGALCPAGTVGRVLTPRCERDSKAI